jgi:orotidine-5'-phosphate decarboxylase
VCLGLDPDPGAGAEAVGDRCRELIAATAGACVAVKPQLACFERLGAPGWAALERTVAAAHEAGLLVVADGKRGDVPHTAEAYAAALFGQLCADAVTVNPLLGADALEPWVRAAGAAGGAVFCLVRTSNPGASDLLDLEADGRPLHEHLAAMVAERAPLLAGSGLSGMGAVVGATEPGHLGRMRELMPEAIFLVPGVGAQGGRASELGAAFSPEPASVLVPASRSIAGASDPAAAAENLRGEVWAASQSAAR